METAIFPALGVTILILILTISIGKIVYNISKKIMTIRDEKMKIVNECYSNIKFVKISSRENYFLDK